MTSPASALPFEHLVKRYHQEPNHTHLQETCRKCRCVFLGLPWQVNCVGCLRAGHGLGTYKTAFYHRS